VPVAPFDNLSQRARDLALNRGCAAQLVFAAFLVGILEIGAAPGRPSSSSAAAAAHNVLKSGSNRLSAGEVRQFWRVLVETGPSEPFHCNRLRAKLRFGRGPIPLYRVTAAPSPPGNGPGAGLKRSSVPSSEHFSDDSVVAACLQIHVLARRSIDPSERTKV